MKTINRKDIILLAGILILWLVEYFALALIFPQHAHLLKFQISAFFMIISILFLIYANKIRQKQYTPRREISILMMFNMIPLLLSLIFILLYVTLINKDHFLFLLIFGINYLWFLIMKSVILYKIDRKETKNEN